MGGNALKHLNPIRLTTLQVMNLHWRIAGIANMERLGRAYLVPWCLDKETHGDVDILVDRTGPMYEGFVNNVCRAFKRLHNVDVEVSRNDTVTSCGIPVDVGGGKLGIAQVDLIAVSIDNLSHTLAYFAGGGLGMMIGRVAAWHGFVFAMDGLRLRKDPALPWCVDIPLTRQPDESLRFLGYDPLGASAFESEEACWRYALSSPQARPHMFVPRNTNAENRSRDKGRPNFVRFQQWLRDTYGDACDADHPEVEWSEAVGVAQQFRSSVRDTIAMLERRWSDARHRIHQLGVGAVQAEFPKLSREECGPIVHDMQALLPHKQQRAEMADDERLQNSLVALARAAARVAGKARGLEPGSVWYQHAPTAAENAQNIPRPEAEG